MRGKNVFHPIKESRESSEVSMQTVNSRSRANVERRFISSKDTDVLRDEIVEES